MRGGALARLEAALPGCRDTDAVAVTTLRHVLEVPGVLRAGLALPVLGGRELRFLPSDPEKLTPSPSWCLIDAFEPLPLNDAVRGRSVALTTPDAILAAYPGVPTRQAGHAVQSIVAVPLEHAGEQLGGLLLYGRDELVGDDPQLHARLARVAALVAAALAGVRRTGDWPLGDDPDGWLLPPDATAPREARRLIRAALIDIDAELLDLALLCASELVTNVVMHTGGPSLLRVNHDGQAVTVEVEQPSAAPLLAPVDAHDPLRISGRGLELVDALASDWGAEPGPDGTTTWFRVESDPV